MNKRSSFPLDLQLPVRKSKMNLKQQAIYRNLLNERMLTSEERKKLRWMIEYSRYDADSLQEYINRINYAEEAA